MNRIMREKLIGDSCRECGSTNRHVYENGHVFCWDCNASYNPTWSSDFSVTNGGLPAFGSESPDNLWSLWIDEGVSTSG